MLNILNYAFPLCKTVLFCIIIFKTDLAPYKGDLLRNRDFDTNQGQTSKGSEFTHFPRRKLISGKKYCNNNNTS